MNPTVRWSAAPRRTEAGAEWQEARIAQRLPQGACRLCDGRLARQALSCLVAPEAGDEVLVFEAAGGLHVLHVLRREGAQAQLSAPGIERLTIAQPELVLQGTRQLDLASHGTLCLSARDVLSHATESLVQGARHFVANAQHCVLQVSALLRLQGKQALITAEQDLKLDAERVTLG